MIKFSLTVSLPISLVQPLDAHEHADGSGFAGAIDAQKTKNLVLSQFKRNAVNSGSGGWFLPKPMVGIKALG
jgi:hypothetical protein